MRLIGLAVVLAVSFALAPLAAEAQQAGEDLGESGIWRSGDCGADGSGRQNSLSASSTRF